MGLENKSEAESLFDAGKAAVGIRTFLIPCPSTQQADVIDDAKQVLRDFYSPRKIREYIVTLKENELIEQAKNLKESYLRLRKISKGILK